MFQGALVSIHITPSAHTAKSYLECGLTISLSGGAR